ncbi:MAG: hypothetical protein R6U43_11035 [Candidatus Krumholzibacteriales bacterium]
MKRIIKNILPLFIILFLFTAGLIIPHHSYGRVEICKQETFGGPGDDPNISTEPLKTDSSYETTTANKDNYKEIEEISILKLHIKVLFNQLTGLIF